MPTFSDLLAALTVDPVDLKVADKLVAILICFISILIVAYLTGLWSQPVQPILVASMGATAVIVFIIPNSPLAQPWPVAGGQVFSALVGIVSAVYIDDITLSAATAVAVSVSVMLLLRCLHPPGAATALAPVLAEGAIDYQFALMPVATNVLIMLTVAVIVNRWLLGKKYPEAIAKNRRIEPRQPQLKLNVSEQDIEHAKQHMESFVDLTTTELKYLHGLIESEAYQRLRGTICCADIMTRDVPVAEFGTELEDAWAIIVAQQARAMPVLDRSRRVIGLLTWKDFFKHINIDVYAGIQEKIRSFIQRSKQVTTNKPEVVGLIMSANIAVLPEQAHIAELIPLMSEQGYRQVPIIDHENRFAGMVYQANLIAALYRQQLGDGQQTQSAAATVL